MVTTQCLNETSAMTLLAITFDYDSSGKQDHFLYYAPGAGQVTIYKTNADGTFAKVYSQSSSTPGFGAGNVDLTNPGDRVIAFDFLGNGKLDHLLCYRPNTGDGNPGLVSILQKNSDDTFQAVFTSDEGIGKYDLANPIDNIVAFDYLSSGKLDHLVCYRSHQGICWILQNNNGNFSAVYQNNGQGIGGYTLLCDSNHQDFIIPYDYSGNGHLDHLVCYCPGLGAIYIIENDNGTFKPTSIQQGYGGSGISQFDLSNPVDRIIAYDYAGSGSQDHLLCYRPGTGLVYILQNTNGAFSPVYPPNGSGTSSDGIGGYMLGNPDACIFAYDYSSSGHEDYLFCYRTAGNASIITVTVQNYANVNVAVVQNKQVLVTLPAAPSSTQPSSAQVQIDGSAEVLLQEPQSNGDWWAVCFVAPNTLKNGSTIMNNVTWGSGVACNIQ
jgi:hypothetical protein